MLKLLIFVFYFIYAASGSGQFIVLQHPKNLEFIGDEAIDGRDIPTVFAASLGFTIRQSSDWRGLKIKSPFGLARALVVVAVDGISSLGSFEKLPVFPINPVQEESRLWRMVQEDVIEHYPMQSNRTLLRVDLGSSNDISDLPLRSLDNDEEESFLQDMTELNSFIDSFKKTGVVNEDNNPVVNWFTLTSLHLLSDVKGAENEVTIEAVEKVRNSLMELGKVLADATNGRALVAAIVSDASHTRRVRAASGGLDTNIPENRATEYSESYPAIFNIMLWFGIAFIFSLIAISYFIGTMDPGRDSIIYRMTSNRMKKDS